MVIDPNITVHFIKRTKYCKIQQSGIDLSLKELSYLHPDMTTAIGEIGVKECHSMPIYPRRYPRELWFFLGPGCYDFTCNEYVKVPKNAVAMLIQRSSLNRCGAYITSGLYDNGFENYVGGVLHVARSLRIQKNTRICQIVFFETRHEAQYKGKYQSHVEFTNCRKGRTAFYPSEKVPRRHKK
ncbi:hypothetical protein LCGC14_2151400 [marine sediment metagenome]|uniref:Uncharacterized protein n=1 Tax=marine sediment metagenome TaxID=412755 RepID=A0A0F9G8I7_9ZZZZ